ncbi:MAG TPA: hypothetical protein VMU38_01145 [Candidatus Binatia bacterium]|nr:hypothetical protein [Candidatus Binatia bacterium]
MKATETEIARLLARYGIAPIETRGTASARAAAGGRTATIYLSRAEGPAQLTLSVGGVTVTAVPPNDLSGALAVVRNLQAMGGLPGDASFEHMLAGLLEKAVRLFDETGATAFALSSLHLHPTSYHIGEATLLHEKPLELKPRLEPDTHDRHAIYDHRHGDSTKFPK